jgi:hypothetical protein
MSDDTAEYGKSDKSENPGNPGNPTDDDDDGELDAGLNAACARLVEKITSDSLSAKDRLAEFLSFNFQAAWEEDPHDAHHIAKTYVFLIGFRAHMASKGIEYKEYDDVISTISEAAWEPEDEATIAFFEGLLDILSPELES